MKQLANMKHHVKTFLLCLTLTTTGAMAQEQQNWLPDGTYYIQNKASGTFISAGAYWGCWGVLREHGIDFAVTYISHRDRSRQALSAEVCGQRRGERAQFQRRGRHSPQGDVQGETGKVQFVAQTYNQPIEGDGACYLSTNGKVKRLAADGSIKGMRAYFLVPDATDAAGVKLFFSGTAVGLHEVTGADTHIAAHEIYDLVGRPVHKSALSRKGIYITNGRKITIKYNSRIKYH